MDADDARSDAINQMTLACAPLRTNPRMRRRTIAAVCLLAVATACGSDGGSTSVRTVARVAVTGATTILNAGQTTQLNAVASDAAGVAIADPGTVAWSSASSNVATADQAGKVTGVSAGNAVITATIAGVKGTINIVVLASVASKDTIFTVGIASFSPPTLVVKPGATVIFALGFDGTGHDVRFAAAPGAPADIPVLARQYVPRTFSVAGNFSYICPTHPQMTGTVTVQ